jgi:hypothetical protein
MQEPAPIVEIARGRIDPQTSAGGLLALALFEREVKAYSQTGRELWSYRAPWPLGAFSVAKGSGHSVVISEDERNAALLDPKGTETARFEDESGFLELALSYGGERIALLSGSSAVTLMESGGKELWKTPVDGACSVQVSAKAGLVGVGIHNGYALLEESGSLLWIRDLPGLSVVFSAITPDGAYLMLVASPGCRIILLDREADFCYQESRDRIPKALSLSESRCFAVSYGAEDAYLGIPDSDVPDVELFCPLEEAPCTYRPTIAVAARCFSLAADGTLTTFANDGIVEAWPPRIREGHLKGTPLWSYSVGGAPLAVAGLGKDGPALTVSWDEYHRELAFDNRSVRDHLVLPPAIRFCIRCSREYTEGELSCRKCAVPLHDASWCAECGTQYCIPLGERCPVHGTRLGRLPHP